MFVRHNIVSVSTVDWHFPQPIVADRTAHVTGAGVNCWSRWIFSGFTRADDDQVPGLRRLG